VQSCVKADDACSACDTRERCAIIVVRVLAETARVQPVASSLRVLCVACAQSVCHDCRTLDCLDTRGGVGATGPCNTYTCRHHYCLDTRGGVGTTGPCSTYTCTCTALATPTPTLTTPSPEGTTTWPGANFVVLPDGEKTFLKFGDRRKIANDLKVPAMFCCGSGMML